MFTYLFFFFFFFNDTATTEIYTLSLHDALPTWRPWRSERWSGLCVQPLLVLRAVVALELLKRLRGVDGVLDDAGHRGQQRRVDPGLRMPERRPLERLGTVEEHLLDVDHERQRGAVPAHHHLVEERCLAHQPSPPVDPQRLLPAGNQEEQPHVRVPQDVLKAVGTPVPGPLRDGQRGVVQHEDESGWVALRRDVAGAVGAGGGDEAERRPGDAGAVRAADGLRDGLGPEHEVALDYPQPGAPLLFRRPVGVVAPLLDHRRLADAHDGRDPVATHGHVTDPGLLRGGYHRAERWLQRADELGAVRTVAGDPGHALGLSFLASLKHTGSGGGAL